MFPKITLVLVFLMMALVLVVRPWGLMGKPDAGHGRVVLPEGILSLERFGQTEKILTAGAALLLLALPWIGDAYLTKVAIEVLTFALAAFSLNFLIGNGGLVSFGHAAYFGLGAYGAGLLATRLGVAMEPALIAAPLIARRSARALFGFFIVRAVGRLPGDAHARLRADRLRRWRSSGWRADRLGRYWRGRSVAEPALGGWPRRLLLARRWPA